VAVRALYLPWLDESARNLQHFAIQSPVDLKPRWLRRKQRTVGCYSSWMDFASILPTGWFGI